LYSDVYPHVPGTPLTLIKFVFDFREHPSITCKNVKPHYTGVITQSYCDVLVDILKKKMTIAR